MECCNSYTIDGNEPNGKITLIDHLGLEFQFNFCYLLYKTHK